MTVLSYSPSPESIQSIVLDTEGAVTQEMTRMNALCRWTPIILTCCEVGAVSNSVHFMDEEIKAAEI